MRYYKAIATGLFLASGLVAGHASAATIDLTGDTWDIENSVDDSGTTWNDSTLTFTSQSPGDVGSDDSLNGYFDWQSSGGSFGREVFTGTLASDLSLSLTGQFYDEDEPRSGLTLSDYNAMVQEDGESILEGTWSDGVPGQWEAFRDVPDEPGTPSTDVPTPTNFALFLLAMAGIAGTQYRRKNG